MFPSGGRENGNCCSHLSQNTIYMLNSCFGGIGYLPELSGKKNALLRLNHTAFTHCYSHPTHSHVLYMCQQQCKPAYHFWAQIVFTAVIHGNHIGRIWVVTSFIFLHSIQQLSSLSSMSSSSSLHVTLTVISILSSVKGPSITFCFHMHPVCKEEKLEHYKNSSSFNSASSFALHKWFYFCFQHSFSEKVKWNA